jgi:vancomycin resistance protein VanJ
MIITTPRAHPSRLTFVRRILLNLFIAITGAYGLSVTGFLLLRALVGERWGVVGFVNSYLHLLILPAVILMPICLLLRRRLLIVELAAPFLLFAVTYGASFMPRAVAAVPDAPQLHLLSYNINGANREIDAVISIITEASADIVLIQELSPLMAKAFDTQLADQYPYRAFHPQEGFSGQGVLSKFPITDDEYWQINLGHQRVEIDWNGTPFTLYNVHPLHPLTGLGYNGTLRAMEITDVLNRAGQEQRALLVVGDFNMTELSEDYARVSALYGDAYKQVGWGMGFTFPDFANAFGVQHIPPLARIDYIFHNHSFTPLEARVWPTSGGSDHFPLYAALTLRP